MRRDEHTQPTGARTLPAGTDGPRWRALLEARWRSRLQEVTELSLAYHGAATPAPGNGNRAGAGDHAGPHEMRRLLRRAVAARQKLADIEEALARLAAGSFGRCEQCGSAIPAGLLTVIPETRYCPNCAAEPVPVQRHALAGHGPASSKGSPCCWCSSA